MSKRRVLFVGDGGDSAALATSLGEGYEIEQHRLNLPFSIGAPRRHLGYLRLALQALRGRRSADCILIWQQFVALYFLLLARLIPGNERPVLLYYVIYKPSTNRLIDWIKRRLMKSMTNARQVSAVYFMSEHDQLFSITNKAVRHLIAAHPFHSPYIEEHLNRLTSHDFYFAGGASNRDYNVIRALAKRMPDSSFRVACMANQAGALMPLPGNLQVHTDIPATEFEDLVLQSKAVIIPLADPNVASGQLVCLAAMQSGKPIFMTRNHFVSEWVDMHVANGFLRLFESDEDLVSDLKSVDDGILGLLGNAARTYYETSHDESAVYRVLADDIRRVVPGMPA